MKEWQQIWINTSELKVGAINKLSINWTWYKNQKMNNEISFEQLVE